MIRFRPPSMRHPCSCADRRRRSRHTPDSSGRDTACDTLAPSIRSAVCHDPCTIAGTSTFSCRNQSSTWRTDCSSANLRKTSEMPSCTRRSGSFSMRSSLGLHVADRDGQMKFAASRLLAHRLHGPLTEDRQLHLAHGALHTEQQPVVGRTRVKDGVLVDDQCADQAAELQQCVPVTAVPCQAGSLQRHNCADSALTDGCQQLLKSRPGRPTAGFAEVIIDNLNVVPAELPRSLDQSHTGVAGSRDC